MKGLVLRSNLSRAGVPSSRLKTYVSIYLKSTAPNPFFKGKVPSTSQTKQQTIFKSGILSSLLLQQPAIKASILDVGNPGPSFARGNLNPGEFCIADSRTEVVSTLPVKTKPL